jgi:hypothetical protein
MPMNTTCPSCGSTITEGAVACASCGRAMAGPPIDLPSAARQARPPMPRSTKIVYGAIIFVISAIFLYLFKENLPGGSHPVIAQQPSVAMATMYMGKTIAQQPVVPSIRNGVVSFSLTELLEKKVIYFDYPNTNSIIPVLAFISAEGKLVTAIRMCEPCNSSEFRIEGVEMVCGRCGTRWKLNNLEGVEGSCQKYPPDPIPSKIVDGQVQIEESVLRSWKMRI